MHTTTENEIEQYALDTLETVGYQHFFGPSISTDGSGEMLRQYNQVVLESSLRAAIERINPAVPADARAQAFRQVVRLSANPENELQKNLTFHRWLTEGIDIEYYDASAGRTRGTKVWLVDFEHIHKNDFWAINQFTIIEPNKGGNSDERRPDIVLFVNGLPLVLIELKNATEDKADLPHAYNQVQTYRRSIPSIFTYNTFVVISDGWFARAGTLSADFNRFQVWRSSTDRQKEGVELETLVTEMLRPDVLLRLIRHFIVFEKETQTGKSPYIKKLAAYHQFYACQKAITSTIRAVQGDQRAGVVWHTQGSGKSLSMAFYTGLLAFTTELKNPTIIVLTDRNDLDDQLFETFANCEQVLRQSPVQIDSKDDLVAKLAASASGGIFFTTIQKFSVEGANSQFQRLSDRKNIIVIADEAHRTQYGFEAKLVNKIVNKESTEKEKVIAYGFAKYMRDALPNATFIGFTGTPVEAQDRNTPEIFGEYIDVYDIQQAVEDGATVKIYYESRLAKVELSEAERPAIDALVEELTEGEEDSERQRLKSKWARTEAIVGSEKRIAQVAADLVKHFESRQAAFGGKAMVVCMSRRICVALHNAIVKLRPDWYSPNDAEGQIKVIMTGSSSDDAAWAEHIRNKPKRRDIGNRLKATTNPLKIVIVRDMWLTGFDAPVLNTLYVDKAMSGHNLMQAIARVNRVFTDKEGGLIVDYIGIGQELKKALSDYTQSNGRGNITFDKAQAIAKMQELHEVIWDLFQNWPELRGQERSVAFFKAYNLKQKLNFLADAADYVLGLEDGKRRFNTLVLSLSKIFALCLPSVEALDIRDDLAIFQAIKARIVKLTETEKPKGRSKEEIETALRQLVSEAVTSSEVIDILAIAGIEKPDLSILSEEFLAEVRNLKRKNVALELLKKILNDEIHTRLTTNVVQTKQFSEMLTEAIRRYQNNAITTAEVIEQLIEIANKLKKAEGRGEKLNLRPDELAFYDALYANQSAVLELGDDTLKTIARELVESVRGNATIDWNLKEAVQAKLRVMVKRILNRYKYPPDLQAQAIQTVLQQAEQLADYWVG